MNQRGSVPTSGDARSRVALGMMGDKSPSLPRADSRTSLPHVGHLVACSASAFPYLPSKTPETANDHKVFLNYFHAAPVPHDNSHWSARRSAARTSLKCE